ncbi:MAG: cupin domain-containing protein [Clostridia bacterium]|nr:cupin domain-containing protein [Clostridia bacterium]
MIISLKDARDEAREHMRGGEGTVYFKHPVANKEDLPKKCRLFAQIIVPDGASMGYHEHSGETEFYYILEGEAILDDGKSKTLLKPGDTVVTGNGDGHSVINHSGADVKMLACIVLD